MQQCLINRALLFDDSPQKSEMSDASTISSSLTCQGSRSSIEEGDDEDIAEDEEEIYDEEAEEDVYEEEDEFSHNLCEGLSKISSAGLGEIARVHWEAHTVHL